MPPMLLATSAWSVQRILRALAVSGTLAALYHTRYGVTLSGSNVTQWDDARGASGFGPSIVFGAGHQPTWDAVHGLIQFTAAAYGFTAASSLFDVSTQLAIATVASFSTATTTTDHTELALNVSETSNLALFGSGAVSGKPTAEINGTNDAHSAVAPSAALLIAVSSCNGATVAIDVPNQTRVTAAGSAQGAGSCVLTLNRFFQANGTGGSWNCRAVAVWQPTTLPTATHLQSLLAFGIHDTGAVAA